MAPATRPAAHRASGAEADGDHVDRVRFQWAQVRPDLDTTPVAVVARLGRARGQLERHLDATLGRFGLTREGWDVLASLYRQGPPHVLSPTELYRGLMRTSGTITSRLHHLERAGLVERHRNDADGRSLLVALTERGVAVVDAAAPVHVASERRLLGSLTADEQRVLAGLLRKLLMDLEMHPPGSAGGPSLRPAPLGCGGDADVDWL